MLSVDIAVPAADVKRLNDRLDSYVAFLRGNVPKAVDSVAVQLVKSLRVATKQKPTLPKGLRPVVPNPKYAKNLKKKGRAAQKKAIADWYDKNDPTNNRVRLDPDDGILGAKWAVLRIRRGARIAMPVFKAGKAAASASKLRNTNKAGLAASTWGWILGKLASVPGKTLPANAARGSVVSTSVDSSGTMYIRTIHNALPYIRPNTNVAQAITKVDSWLRGRMERTLADAKQAARIG